MLHPKPTPERRPVSDESGRDEGFSRAPAEPRSFAPRAAPLPSPATLDGLLPQAWDRIDPRAVIRVAEAPQPSLSAEEQAARRALIVIPCLNEEKVIAGVIEQILADDGLVDPLVLVADGGSSDCSREIVAAIAARDPRVRLMPNPGKLQSAGMNLAAAAMAGDRPWLVRVDAHADYPPNYASTLIAEARRTGADSVVVSMDTRGEAPFQQAVAVAQNSVLGTGGSAHRLATEGHWVDHGHHALFSVDAYRAVGGYDESFSHNEDAELDLRLAKQGRKIWLTDKIRIGYHPRSTPKALAKQYFSYGKGRARTVLKHYTPLKVRQALPLAVAPAVAGLALAPLWWVFAIPALVWMAAALGYGAMLGVKRRDATAAMSGPAAMIMHLAWSAGFWAQLFTWSRERKDAPPAQLAAQAAS
ncbi:glycosyltransferase family 2 protein [Phenylobacterium sp. J367]|uniref:glycosyltransferase family 2 protein n=1 Tax=Phenylobacterium sp. J367 TaxID=2898435 RepID=UPI002151CF6E|nr:glycosyltransferase family 2 protein [Phenylobacterium sp. J367]MCR5880884.1 glycosyltransferase family 2 protein [Phenylobacterium sp. J367]